MSYKTLSKKMQNFINELEAFSAANRKQISIKNDNCFDSKLCCGALFYSLIDQLKGLSLLLEQENTTSVMVLIRGVLEASFNILLCEDELEIYKSYEKNKIKEEINSICDFLKKDIENLSLDEKCAVLDVFSSYDRLNDHLSEANPKYLKSKKKIEKVLNRINKHGHQPQFKYLDSFYAYLSEHAHHGHIALRERHIKECGQSYQVSRTVKFAKHSIYNAILYTLFVVYFALIIIKFHVCGGRHDFKPLASTLENCIVYLKKKVNY
jgi:hypothetical protein